MQMAPLTWRDEKQILTSSLAKFHRKPNDHLEIFRRKPQIAVQRAVYATPCLRDKPAVGGIPCQTDYEFIGKTGTVSKQRGERRGLAGRKHGDGLGGYAPLQKAGIVGKRRGNGKYVAYVKVASCVKHLFSQGLYPLARLPEARFVVFFQKIVGGAGNDQGFAGSAGIEVKDTGIFQAQLAELPCQAVRPLLLNPLTDAQFLFVGKNDYPVANVQFTKPQRGLEQHKDRGTVVVCARASVHPIVMGGKNDGVSATKRKGATGGQFQVDSVWKNEEVAVSFYRDNQGIDV